MENKKGFVFVETIVVLTVTMISLLLLYRSYVLIINRIEQKTYYDNVNDVFRASVAKQMVESLDFEGDYLMLLPTENNCTYYMSDDCPTILTELDINKVYIIKNMTSVKNMDANTIITNPLKRYLKTVDNNDYTLVVQRGEGYYASLKMNTEEDGNTNLNNQGNSNTNIPTPAVVTPYAETLLHGSDPVLGEGLIPVTLSSTEDDWTVKYANIEDEWYNYGQSKWANAVILVDNPSRPYKAGDIIRHEDINAYFVWIPRYKYKLFNMGNYNSLTEEELTPANQLIDIVFGTDTTTDTDTSCATPMESGASGNCEVDKWMTHPSFISFNSNGFWVGKFETTGSISDGIISSITVKPGISPITRANNYEIFTKSYNYSRSLDSHMMKNTEWGTIVYLSHSLYGMGKKNIYINNYDNEGRKTGCVADGPNNSHGTECLNQWFSSLGFNGSTTKNITGLYDMSGGVWERVVGYRSGMMGSSGFSTSSTDSNYIGLYDSKYFDVYLNNGNSESFKNRILGDATGEIGAFKLYYDNPTSNWYHDYAAFVNSSSSWFLRGGSTANASYSGLFSFSMFTGKTSSSYGFRVVLTP